VSEPREIEVLAPDCNLCLGCLDMAPEIFAFDDTLNLIRILQNPVDPDEVRLAMTSCPRQAIVYTDGKD
jgi:ferredoxin